MLAGNEIFHAVKHGMSDLCGRTGFDHRFHDFADDFQLLAVLAQIGFGGMVNL